MISLQSAIKSTAGWCFSLGRKFMGVTPTSTLIVQAASLSAQILLVFTFFLPIKILILLGSDTIPHYYPLYFKSLKQSHLIMGLSALALICYVLYLISELTVSFFSKKGAQKLLTQSAKLTLFEKQYQLAVQAYERFTRGLSAGTFAIIAFLILAYIYPFLFIVSISYIFITSILIISLHNRSTKIRTALHTHYKVVLNAMSSVGFLMTFFCMIADFLYMSPPKILAALIALLVIRQGMSRVAVLLQEVISLRAQHRQINALFFHSQPLISNTTSPPIKIKNLLDEKQRSTWIQNAINAVSTSNLKLCSTTWHQLGRSNIYSFEATARSDSEQFDRTYLIKVFDNNSFSLAEQEFTLLTSTLGIPAPAFRGKTKVEDLECHIFEIGDLRKATAKEVGPGAISINRALLAVEPSETLTKRFSRSHLFLEQRLSSELLSSLDIVTTQEHRASFELFSKSFHVINKILSTLPRQIISLDITPDTLLISDTDQTCVSHWASWKMEPLGASWPIGEQPKLEQAFEQAKLKRQSLADVSVSAVLLCALVYAFESLCQRARYVEAIALMPDMLRKLESAQLITSNRDNTP
ncbi:hypothetical protein ACLE2W_01575 [Pseudomonas shahriarae]|uniref:hypothetical protein n=2 Tax=Gammaproteobacteria TaxID=1236 RepID=UPI00207695C1|nr:hypothetical protein [Pseudomonas shahriarae]MCM8558809.1 hypothetical protein [Pseudomonas shahriarae]